MTPEEESLIQGYVEGQLDADEAARLHALIREQPGLVQPILAALSMDSMVRAALATETIPLPAVKPRRSRWLLPASLAASLVLLAAGAVFLAVTRRAETTSGPLVREVWHGVPGLAVSDLTAHPKFGGPPDEQSFRGRFETAATGREHYGARLKALLRPPQTGAYTFWITGDDAAELWLSADAEETNKVRIARLDTWTIEGDWNHEAAQQSAPIQLQGGNSYFIEVLHKQETAGDFVAVAWQPPGRGREIIPGSALAPAPVKPAKNP